MDGEWRLLWWFTSRWVQLLLDHRDSKALRLVSGSEPPIHHLSLCHLPCNPKLLSSYPPSLLTLPSYHNNPNLLTSYPPYLLTSYPPNPTFLP